MLVKLETSFIVILPLTKIVSAINKRKTVCVMSQRNQRERERERRSECMALGSSRTSAKKKESELCEK